MKSEIKRTICISTLDPSSIGGVRSMLKFLYRETAKYFDPFLVYNIVPGFRNGGKEITFLPFVKGVIPRVKNEKFEEMQGVGIERVLPEIEFLNYILNLNNWKDVISSSDIFFAVGG